MIASEAGTGHQALFMAVHFRLSCLACPRIGDWVVAPVCFALSMVSPVWRSMAGQRTVVDRSIVSTPGNDKT